jgi:hypothetical protein
MLKTDAEVEALLSHVNNGLNKIQVQVKTIGSGNHGNQSHEGKNAGNQLRDKEDQAIVGTLATLIGGKATAELTGLHPAAISKYRNGRDANNVPNGESKKILDAKLDNINNRIVDKVDQLLDIFAEDKMSELKAHEIPSSAEKLISMFDKIKRRNDENGAGIIKPQVLLWAPKQINIGELISKQVD